MLIRTSTALRSRLGEEPFDRVRHDHDAVVAGASDRLTRRRQQAEALRAQIGGSGG